MTRRNALAAGLLSMASPGLGFLYLGRPRWAFAVPLGLLLFWAGAAWSRIIFVPLAFAAVAIVLLGAWLATIVAAVRIARRAAAAESPGAWQRWHVYLAFFAGSALLHGVLIENRDRLFGYGTFRYRSLSMLETMVWGDYFVCDTWRYRSGGPRRGDIVVFRHPDDPSRRYVDRVIGLPGEVVQIRDGVVRIDGRRLDEPYLLAVNNRGLFPGDSSATVPPASYFVMGDNRDNSPDSRMWGSVPHDALDGRVEFIWFSFSWKDGLRTARIGTRPH